MITNNEISELMQRRRRQILVNSCIYYRFGKSIITDKQFDKWAYELADLQKEHPELARQGEFCDSFENWDGTTGYQLPMWGNWCERQALRLVEYAEKKGLLL